MARLGGSQRHSSNLAQLAVAKRDAVTQLLDEVELEWESNDKLRSGRTTLGNRIKKLEKVVMAEEASIGREMEQLRELNLELDYAAMEVMGENAYDQVLQGNHDWSCWDLQQQNEVESYSVEAELELEKARWADVIEATNKAAKDAMKESEKVRTSLSLRHFMFLNKLQELSLRHDKIQQSFYQLLRDEDYY